MPETGGIASSDVMIAVTLLGVLLVLSMAGAAVVLVIGPRVRLKRRMATLGLVAASTGKQTARAANPRQRQVQEKINELAAKGIELEDGAEGTIWKRAG